MTGTGGVARELLTRIAARRRTRSPLPAMPVIWVGRSRSTDPDSDMHLKYGSESREREKGRTN